MASSTFSDRRRREKRVAIVAVHFDDLLEHAVHRGKDGASNKVCVNPATEPRI